MVLLCSFIQLNNTPCIYVPHLLYPITLSVDIYVPSMSWLLQVAPQWTLGCMYLFKLWFSPDKCPDVGLLDHMILPYLVFLRNLTIFHSGCTNLHSSQQCRSVLLFFFFPHSPAFIVCRFFDDGHSDQNVRWYLIVGLICISLIISNAEHLFVWLLVIHMFSLKKCIFIFSAHFWLDCFFDIELHEVFVYFEN